ncbi:ROK family protein [Microbacterium sp. NPDC057659]|uniref:ROK family transcriptional regulator n=1 Tax=Microbacterium sp. NPDC057659 TaxID=3346198 RepID=UPI00366EB469
MRALRTRGAIGLTELAQETGLSRPTAEGIVDALSDSGWIVEEPAPAGQPGRPGRVYSLRADGAYVLGIDIGSATVRAAVADATGAVLAEQTVAVDPAAGRDDRLTATHSTALAAVAASGLSPEMLAAVCVGTTGTVSADGKVSLSDALPGWTGTDLAGSLAEIFSCPIRVENDCHLAAAAEAWAGVAAGRSNIVYIHCGLRTGAGILIDGRVYRGAHGMSGEIGALRLLGWHRASAHLAGAHSHGAVDVFTRAAQGDPDAERAVHGYASDLAEGIAALVLTLDPEVVVLGGGISGAGDRLVTPLRAALTEMCLTTPELAISALGDRAVLTGSLKHAIDLFESRLYDPDHPLIPAVAR